MQRCRTEIGRVLQHPLHQPRALDMGKNCEETTDYPQAPSLYPYLWVLIGYATPVRIGPASKILLISGHLVSLAPATLLQLYCSHRL